MKALGLLGFATDAAPDHIREAVDRRRQASMTGKCACGGTVEGIPIPGAATISMFPHEHDCTASDDALDAMNIQPEWIEDRWVVFHYPSGMIERVVDTLEELHR